MQHLFQNCTLCPRLCGIDRSSGKLGYCHSSDSLFVARAALHAWEEPCISGIQGSGTIFFAGCSLRCTYCQNHLISGGKHGRKITVSRLSDIFFELAEQGAHNINFVTPTHYVPYIMEAIKLAKAKNFTLPFVYNTSGYERVETLRMLDGLIDIYLPDFKYDYSETALLYSSCPDYPEIARSAFDEMFRQVGPFQLDDQGLLEKGLVARHLILPGHTSEAKNIISYLYHRFEDEILFSIMNQYTPMPHLPPDSPINRTLTEEEYDSVVRYALSLGIENAYIQEGGTATESFIPEFNYEGI